MGNVRFVLAWFVASTVGLVSGLPHVTLADDSGPGREVRAIRHDVPVLVRARTPGPIAVNRVAVSGAEATADWSAGSGLNVLSFHGTLERRYDVWWLTGEELEGGTSTPEPIPSTPANIVRFDIPNSLASTLSGYRMSMAIAKNDAASATLEDMSGRPPTEAESWMTRGGNSYFFFSGTVQSAAPIHVQAGTTIEIWFPFVLDTSLYYGLTIAHADKPIGPIDGTLKDNVVHFVLPAFTLAPGATIMGEVEGDSFRHE